MRRMGHIGLISRICRIGPKIDYEHEDEDEYDHSEGDECECAS